MFSAAVTAFIIESYKLLVDDSGDLTVLYLAKISQQLAVQANTSAPALPAPAAGDNRTMQNAIRINVLWVLTLVISLSCALGAILVQTWANRYQQLVEGYPTISKRVRIREFYYQGLKRSRLIALADSLPTLLHIALFLFFAGLIEFFLPINSFIAYGILAVVLIPAVCYIAFTASPLIWTWTPYITPWTKILRYMVVIIYYITWQLAAWTVRCLLSIASALMQGSPEARTTLSILERNAPVVQSWDFVRPKYEAPLSEIRDQRALQWSLDHSPDDSQLERFTSGIEAFVMERARPGTNCKIVLNLQVMVGTGAPSGLGGHVRRLLRTCVDPAQLPEVARQRRVKACMTSLRALLMHSFSDELQNGSLWEEWFSEEVARNVEYLKDDEDVAVSLHSHCTATAIVLRALLDLWNRVDSGNLVITVPTDWNVWDLAACVLQHRQPELHEMGVVALLLQDALSTASFESFFAGLEYSRPSHQDTHRALHVSVPGSDLQDRRKFNVEEFLHEGCLTALNTLVDHFLSRPFTAQSDLDLITSTLRSAVVGWSASGTLPETQRVYIRSLRRILGVPKQPGFSDTLSEAGEPGIVPVLPAEAVEALLQIVDTLDDNQCRNEGQRLLQSYWYDRAPAAG